MHGQHDLQNLYSRSRIFIDFEHVEFSSLPKTKSSSPEQRSGFPTSIIYKIYRRIFLTNRSSPVGDMAGQIDYLHIPAKFVKRL